MYIPRFVICKDTFHYKYWAKLRQWWGFSIPERTSLCPYFQFTLWFTILRVLLIPVSIVGWIGLHKPISYLIGVKSIIPFPSDPKKFPPVITNLIGTLTVFTILSFVFIIGTICGTINWGDITGAATWVGEKLGWAAVYTGWFVIVTAGMIWYGGTIAVSGMAEGVQWLFTNGPLWKAMGSIVGAAVFGWVAAVLVIRAVRRIYNSKCVLPWRERAWSRTDDWVTQLFSWLDRREKKRKIRRSIKHKKFLARKEAKKKSNIQAWSDRETKRIAHPNMLKRAYHVATPFGRVIGAGGIKIGSGVSFVGSQIGFGTFFVGNKIGSGAIFSGHIIKVGAIRARDELWSHDAIVRKSSAKMLGIGMIIWHYILAVKRGVCPMLEFADADEVEDRLVKIEMEKPNPFKQWM